MNLCVRVTVTSDTGNLKKKYVYLVVILHSVKESVWKVVHISVQCILYNQA